MSRKPALVFELGDPLQGAGSECRRIARDRRLICSLHVGDSAVERGNQFDQFTNESGARQLHTRAPDRFVRDRVVFQTSPQFVHLQ
jgi:hypothetical protein